MDHTINDISNIEANHKFNQHFKVYVW